MNDELKACPFCGAKLTKSVVDRETFYQHPMVNGCHLRAMLFTKYKWNTRPIEDALRARIAELEEECASLGVRLHDEMSQLEIATDLGNKRWIALNEIYEKSEKHSAWWCKRKAQEGLGIK